MYSLNQLIAQLKTFSQSHKQINSFGVGDPHEIGSGKLKLGYMARQDNAGSVPIYPLVWMDPKQGVINGNESYLTFQIIVMDLVDKAEAIEEDVMSDTHLICHDLVRMLQNESDVNKAFVMIDKQIKLTAFTEKFDDEVTGWFMDFTIKFPFAYSTCELPIP